MIRFSYKKLFNTLIIIFIMTSISCNKLPNSLSWDSSIQAPIIHSRLDIGDIFVDSLLQYNPDQSVSLVLKQQITAIDQNKLIEVHDTLASGAANIPFSGYPIPPGQKLVEKTSEYEMKLGDMELTISKATTANIGFFVTNELKQPIIVRYDVISSSKNGQSFFVIDKVPAADLNGPFIFVKHIDLSGYIMDFTGSTHNKSNMVITKTTIWIDQDADTLISNKEDSIIFSTVFDDFKIEYVRGYFGQFKESNIDTSHLSTFSSFHSGLFDLKSVKAHFEIENGLGADVQMNIKSINSINTKNGIIIPLQHQLIGQNINILRATETGNPLFPVNPTVYQWDLSQANITEMIENQPDQLSYEIDYKLNPLGNISGGNDFIYSGHTIRGNIFMEIPLNVRMDSLVIQQPTSIDFDKEGKIKDGNLLIITKNLFPFDVSIQFYLLDDNELIMDSLLLGNVISNHGIISQSGYVVSPTIDEIPMNLSPEKLEKLRNTKKVLVRAKIQSGHSGHLQLYEHYNIDIKVIMEADYEF